MEEKYLVDTNILIYYLDDKIPENAINIIKEIFKNSLIISIITKCELLSWKGYDNEGFKAVKDFISCANIIDLDNSIADLAIDIMRKNNIELPDAVIAASAIHNNAILLTRNEKDFKKVPELKIYNPF
ncbi:MAG: nucleotide-binding protein [Candidatus Melainabacteria bacterium GWF2_37_15]|nr:MAG: nucleotide-binding protein [Candidatus Melainabacteria bacterium GWF2_37_15]